MKGSGHGLVTSLRERGGFMGSKKEPKSWKMNEGNKHRAFENIIKINQTAGERKNQTRWFIQMIGSKI